MERWKIFYRWGIDGIGGLSYKINSDYSFSCGGGIRASRIWTEDGKSYESELDPALGFFLDFQESLLFSLYAYSIETLNIRINIYPGLYKFDNYLDNFGCFLSLDNQTFQAGLICNLLPLGVWGGSYQYHSFE